MCRCGYTRLRPRHFIIVEIEALLESGSALQNGCANESSGLPASVVQQRGESLV